MNLKNTDLLSFDAVDTVFLSWSSFKNGLYSLIILALLVLEILLFLPIVIKFAFNNFSMLAAKIHGLRLEIDAQAEPLV